MTLFSWIGIGGLVAIIIIGSIVKIITKKKKADLEGFCGVILPVEEEKKEKKQNNIAK